MVRARTSLTEALDALDASGAEVVLVVSPHGRRAGVYRSTSGSLNGFGVQGVTLSARSRPEVAERIADRWGGELLDEPADHGVVVPALLARWEGPVVAVALPETTGPDRSALAPVRDRALSLAGAIRTVAADWSAVVIASAHGAASLHPRAPLGERSEGAELERLLLNALGSDVGALTRIAPELWTEAGSCGAGPLTAFGELFAGGSARVAAYEVPAGVSYLVAETSNGAAR